MFKFSRASPPPNSVEHPSCKFRFTATILVTSELELKQRLSKDDLADFNQKIAAVEECLKRLESLPLQIDDGIFFDSDIKDSSGIVTDYAVGGGSTMAFMEICTQVSELLRPLILSGKEFHLVIKAQQRIGFDTTPPSN